MQKIDIGIVLCHFMSVTDGKLAISELGEKVPDAFKPRIELEKH